MSSTLGKLFAKVALAAALILTVPAVATPAQACGDHATTPDKAVPADAAKLLIPIEGMTCEGCANKIHNVLLTLEGVYVAHVDHAKGQAFVAFDGNKVTEAAIAAAIDKAGYKPGKATVPRA